MPKKLYCSLDLEGTGLDPAKDHITEVGAVIFDISEDGTVNFHDEFSQLVKPPIPIPPFIQDLTNIREADVADAPEWKEVLPKFKKFVGKHPIVGQNIMFDLKFLEAHGLPFTQVNIDTQELARIFAPNARFYNMEYLFRYFGLTIESHHRALTDSKSAAILLQEIVRAFHMLPGDTKKTVADLLSRSNLQYKEFFTTSNKVPARVRAEKTTPKKNIQQTLFATGAKEIILEKEEIRELSKTEGELLVRLPVDAVNDAGLEQVSQALQGAIVVPESSKARSLAVAAGRQLLADPNEILCMPRLEGLIKRKELPDTLTALLAKILVWEAVKEEGQTLQSLSLVGPEYTLKQLFCCDWRYCSEHGKTDGEKCEFNRSLSAVSRATELIASHSSWLSLVKNNIETKCKQLSVWESGKFISSLEQQSVRTFSVRWLRSAVGVLSDSDKEEGMLHHHEQFRKQAEEFLNQLDLDFGLLAMELNSELQLESKFSIDAEVRDAVWFGKIRQAYDKLNHNLQAVINVASDISKKDEAVTQILSSLEEQLSFLNEFFVEPKETSVYWIDGYRSELKLKSRTLSLPDWKTEGLIDIKLFDLWSDRSAIDYASRTLGFAGQELFEFSEEKKQLNLFLPDEESGAEQASLIGHLKHIIKSSKGRTLVVFNSQKNLETTYESFRETLNKHLLAQRITGHHWKNAEMYGQDDRATWFISAHDFLKQIDTLPPTQTLVITRIPYEASDSGFFGQDSSDAFMSFVMPRTVMRIEQFVMRLMQSGPGEEKSLVITDKRILKDYNEPLLSAVESLCSVTRMVLGDEES